jgi:hypothetical protein
MYANQITSHQSILRCGDTGLMHQEKVLKIFRLDCIAYGEAKGKGYRIMNMAFLAILFLTVSSITGVYASINPIGTFDPGDSA